MSEEVSEETRPADTTDLAVLYLNIGLTHLVPLEKQADMLGSSMMKAFRMLVSLVRVIRKLNEELEQRRGQMVNLERRIFDLEQKLPKKGKIYKEYTEEVECEDNMETPLQ